MSAAVTATLAPISLEELAERAGLLTRLDRKYVLPRADLPVLLGGLPADVRVLEIGGARAFDYRSVYFDTPDLVSFRAAAHRRRRRYKIRVRSYLDSDQHFVEVKTRGQRGTTVKQRVPYGGRPDTLDAAARAHVRAVLTEARIPAGDDPYAPALVTHYRRTTLFVPDTGSRVTVDTDLTWSLPDGTTVATPDRAVVETKSARASGDVDRLLWSLAHRPCALSKYATGLAALRPDLPANRWRPVLRRHFHQEN